MGSTTAGTAKSSTPSPALTKALAQHMRESLLPGDTPFAEAQLDDAAGFTAAAALLRRKGEPGIAIETVNDTPRYTRIAIINEDMPFLVDLRGCNCRTGPLN